VAQWWAAAIAVAFVCLFSTTPAQACSICLAGDPSFNSDGASAGQEGDFSFYVEVRGWEKRSGALPHEDEEGDEEHAEGDAKENNKSQRLDLYASWTPIDRLTLTANLPVAFNEINEKEGAERTRLTLDGVGDFGVMASVVLWRDRDVLPEIWVEARAFLKTPTGKSKSRVKGTQDPHLQRGTGSWDFGFGLAGARRFDWGSFYTSASYRVNTKGSLSYEYGDVVLANLAAEIPIGHTFGVRQLQWLTLGSELNYRWAAKDKFRGARFADSGGHILYYGPSIRITLPWFEEWRAPSIRAGAQIPLTSSWLNNRQSEDPLWSVGLLVPF
jgi:hypothetical protein